MSAASAYDDPSFIEAYGAAWENPDTLANYYAESGVYTDVGSAVSATGHDEIRQFAKAMLAFAPDSKVTFTTFMHTNSFFVAEWDWSGTAIGRLVLHGRGFEPKNRTFSVSGVAVCSVDKRGKLLSHKDFWDTGALLQQVERTQTAID